MTPAFVLDIMIQPLDMYSSHLRMKYLLRVLDVLGDLKFLEVVDCFAFRVTYSGFRMAFSFLHTVASLRFKFDGVSETAARIIVIEV